MIIDSALSVAEAIRDNPSFPCPPEILVAQRCITVRYRSFDERAHQGQIVVHEHIATDIAEIFAELYRMHFPIGHIVPIADLHFGWDDIRSMEANNTSGFNYRTVLRTNTLSWHAYGLAVDINPLFNPYILDDVALPVGATHNPLVPGTITADSPIVSLFKSRGFIWGGHWENRRDYQHFEKHLSEVVIKK